MIEVKLKSHVDPGAKIYFKLFLRKWLILEYQKNTDSKHYEQKLKSSSAKLGKCGLKTCQCTVSQLITVVVIISRN